ncbi:PAS domain S-box-containing protein [Aequitasia blattaphilus]|uniref:Stage 0 sporulation protein A homolog n=1 Tax=Aequitasia blattaphilus TaxID=2949332 RepID=A0ABT1EBX8_9FIRM|nr:response regulator [Aequitasia blattaphilus]MCP1103149.1 response regulator [Aequitasia blattaphilus]MCR8615789.1 response regulator [Aequitasia blattaphilus]
MKTRANLSVEEMERLCDKANIGLLNLNVQTGEIQLNRPLTLLAGYEPGELPHSKDTKLLLVCEDDRPRVMAAMGKLMSREAEEYSLEYRMRRKDGSMVSIFEHCYVAETDEKGGVVRIVGIATDLSILKWAEEKARMMERENRKLSKSATHSELEEQNRMLRAANHAATMIIGGFHQDYEVVLQQSLQILGESIQAQRVRLWRNVEIEGELCCFNRAQWWGQISPMVEADETVLSYRDIIPNQEDQFEYDKDIISLTKELSKGFEPYVNNEIKSHIVIPLFLHGEFWGAVAFGDVNRERVFTEDEIEIMCSGTLVIASSVSRNETFGKLNEAREKAMASTKAKGEFLSRMSHEIRTPMNAIIGMTTIAMETDEPERVRYCLEKVDTSSKQLLELINDVLDMSKIEANKLEIMRDAFDFEKMIQYVAGMMQVKIDEKNQEFHVAIERPFKRQMISDELRLSQVLLNLLSNAIKFTPEHGQVTLKIKETELNADKSRLHIEVIDTGIGIEKEKIETLFDSFEQADGSITRQYGGSGLGLSISQSIIKLMGGEIWIESEVGVGSKFIFEIDVDWNGAIEDTNFDMELPSKVRVLVVDDKEDVLEYFYNILHGFSIHTNVALNGETAIELVKKSLESNKPYDVIFVDFKMPGLNGVDTIKEIRSLVDKKTSCVMMSVSERSDVEEDMKDLGVSNFLTKPILPSVLYNNILELTQKNIVKPMTEKTKEVPDWSNKTILLAEDVAINREIVDAILKKTHVNLIFAENGKVALDQFKEYNEKIDLILMDVQMPIMDGLSATRAIRELSHQEYERIPIVAMTAHAFKEDIERCKASGMDDHLAKPINVDEVFRVLNRYL